MLDHQSVKIFDTVLNYYNWPEHSDDSILNKLAETNNFNHSTYKLAVSCYIHWCVSLYERCSIEERDGFKLAFAQQTLNILHEHAPQHHIHKALNEY